VAGPRQAPVAALPLVEAARPEAVAAVVVPPLMVEVEKVIAPVAAVPVPVAVAAMADQATPMAEIMEVENTAVMVQVVMAMAAAKVIMAAEVTEKETTAAQVAEAIGWPADEPQLPSLRPRPQPHRHPLPHLGVKASCGNIDGQSLKLFFHWGCCSQ